MKNKFYILLKILKSMMLLILLFTLCIENNIVKWMLMEIFTLIFIGFFMNYELNNKIGSLFYFYISSIISLLLFWSLMIYYNYWSWELWDNFDNNKIITKKIIQYLILMKLGVYPFQFWMPMIFELLEWNTIFLFSTINKLLPIYILTTLYSFNDPVFMYFILLNSVISVIYAINEENYKKIMAYSSINHTTYIILLSYFNTYMSILYFFIYMLNSFIYMKLMETMNLNNKEDLLTSYHSKLMNFLFMFFTLSYSMLPPLMFFIIKWMFFYELNFSNYPNFYIYTIMFSSVIMTYNYLDMAKFSIMHKKMFKKQIMLNIYYKNNKFKCKMIMFMFNLFIFCLLFY